MTGTATTGAGGGGGSARPPLVEQAANPAQHERTKSSHILRLGMSFLLDGADSSVGSRSGLLGFKFGNPRHLFGPICIHAQMLDRRGLGGQGGVALRERLVTFCDGGLPSVEFGHRMVVPFRRRMRRCFGGQTIVPLPAP